MTPFCGTYSGVHSSRENIFLAVRCIYEYLCCVVAGQFPSCADRSSAFFHGILLSRLVVVGRFHRSRACAHFSLGVFTTHITFFSYHCAWLGRGQWYISFYAVAQTSIIIFTLWPYNTFPQFGNSRDLKMSWSSPCNRVDSVNRPHAGDRYSYVVDLECFGAVIFTPGGIIIFS